MAVKDFTFTQNIGRAKRPHLGIPNIASNMPEGTEDGLEVTGCRFSFALCYDDPAHTILLAHMFGAVADAGSGPSSYTHTFTLSPDVDTLKGLTVCARIGTSGTKQKTLYGGRINKWDITWEPGGHAIVSVEVMCKGANALASLTSLTPHASPTYVISNHGSTISWNSDTPTARRCRLACDRAMATNYGIGSAEGLAELDDIGDVTLEATLNSGETGVTDHEAAYIAATSSDATFSFTRSTHTLAGTLHNAQLMDPIERAASRPGIIQYTAKWRGLADTTDSGLAIVVTNDVANYNT